MVRRIREPIGKSFNGKRFTEGKRIISQDEYDYWFNIGLEAFERGDRCIPAHNKELMDYIKEHPSIRNTEINDESQFKRTEKITKAWTDGWIYGNNKKYDTGKFFEATDNTLRRLGEGNSSLKLKKVKTGKYTTTDGKYEIEKSDGFWYAVDTKTGQSVVDCENSLSAIKDSLESYIKSHDKKESFRRLREGDASKKTNYAVIVRDMNKGTYNLYTGTKADCEQLLSDLNAFESFANECNDEDEYFAEEEYIIDLLSSYECLPEIYRNMIDRNDNYNVGLHYSDYLGGMIHIINADNPIDLYI